MAVLFSSLADASLKAAIIPIIANELRGLILVGPVLYGMYESGGNLMALWIGFCSLCGVGLSVGAPLLLARGLRSFSRLDEIKRAGRGSAGRRSPSLII